MLGGVTRRIRKLRFGKSAPSQLAGVAMSARLVSRWIVTAHCHRVVDAQRGSQANDLRLGHLDQWGANPNWIGALDSPARSEIRRSLERRDEFGTAVGISRVVQRVDSNEDVSRGQHLGEREGER